MNLVNHGTITSPHDKAMVVEDVKEEVSTDEIETIENKVEEVKEENNKEIETIKENKEEGAE